MDIFGFSVRIFKRVLHKNVKYLFINFVCNPIIFGWNIMKNKSKIKIFIVILGLIFAFLSISNYNIFNEQDGTIEIRNEGNFKRLKKSGGYVESFIHIDGSIPGNWSATTSYGWCYIDNGVYVIENVTIDASSSPTGSGILINNYKNEYFIIRNCTVYNF